MVVTRPFLTITPQEYHCSSLVVLVGEPDQSSSCEWSGSEATADMSKDRPGHRYDRGSRSKGDCHTGFVVGSSGVEGCSVQHHHNRMRGTLQS